MTTAVAELMRVLSLVDENMLNIGDLHNSSRLPSIDGMHEQTRSVEFESMEPAGVERNG